MDEKTTITLKEIVTVRKFDHTHDDHPTEPVEVLVRESVTEISAAEAAMLGFVPQSETVHISDTLGVSTVPVQRISVGDSGQIGGTD